MCRSRFLKDFKIKLLKKFTKKFTKKFAFLGLKIVYKYRKINVHSKTYIYHIYIMYISPAGRVVYICKL